MITTTTKQKGGIPFIYNGIPVWLHRDKGDGTAAIRYCPSKLDAEIVDVVSFEDLSPVKKVGKGIVSKPKVLNESEKAFKASLSKFFDVQITMLPKECEECDTPFTGYHESELRGLIAHILPKSPNSGFPGVATHPLNRMFLGTKCGCHNFYDNMGAEDRAAMKVYQIALKRFSGFAHLLSARDLLRAYKYLNIKTEL